MRLALPGKPQAKSQTLCTARWRERRIVAYISGNALIILGGPNEILQTIHHDRAKDLDAVTVDGDTGKIAICWANTVYVYRPYEQTEDLLRWSLQCSFDVDSSSNLPQTLSWGSSEELLVGSDALRLYETNDDDNLIWDRQLSSPVILAIFSHDASMIASVAQHDRLAKVWRRRSYGSDDVRFDYSYLPHPTTVTGVQWRQPDQDDHHQKNVLYTVCADHKIRIWAASNPHALQLLQPWAEIDMQSSIQPRIETAESVSDRFVFLIGSTEFAQATSNTAIMSGKNSAKRHFVEHLLDIAIAKPDICIVLDSRGHMSAWAVDHVGAKSRSDNDVHNIAHVENFNALTMQASFDECQGIQVLSFASQQSQSQLSLLVHWQGQRIDWLDGEVANFFDPSSSSERLKRMAKWAGHDRTIERLVPSSSGKSFASYTTKSECIVWKTTDGKDSGDLDIQSRLVGEEKINGVCLLDKLDLMVVLHDEAISLWDVQFSAGRLMNRHTLEAASFNRSLFHIPEYGSHAQDDLQYFVTTTLPTTITMWAVTVSGDSKDGIKADSHRTASMDRVSSVDLQLLDHLLQKGDLVKQPLSTIMEAMPKLSMVQNRIVLHLTDGLAYTSKLRMGDDKSSHSCPVKVWPLGASFNTNVENPYLIVPSSTQKMALVDKTGTTLTIWDLSIGEMEYVAKYNNAPIAGLKWLATPTGLSALAVGFAHNIIILAETRLDQSEDAQSLWVKVRKIQFQDQTSQVIGDFIPLGNGDLVVASGNQLTVVGGDLSTNQALSNHSLNLMPGEKPPSLFSALEFLNSSLPLYHPQHLLHLALAGKAELARTVLMRLYSTLKFFSDGDVLSSGLEVPAEDFYQESPVMANGSKAGAHTNNANLDEEDTLSSDKAFELLEKMKSIKIPNVTQSDQRQLAHVIESISLEAKSQRSLDQNGKRFSTLFNYFMLSRCKISVEIHVISWREICWAYHSQSQEILLDQISRHFDGKMLWQSARQAGIFMWITDHTALRTQFEAVARNEYVKTDERNPIDCSLFYLALRKKTILQGLWRMASWNREQSSTQKLLANNFADPRWKTAALKNAYALLGRRRFEYAAAFFLLAENLRDAVNVCANQMHDLQLAIAVARIYEGNDDGDVLRDLLRNRVLPEAAATGNRWMASWAYWMLGSAQGKGRDGDKRRALQVLMIDHDLSNHTSGNRLPDSKPVYNVDPAQVVLYRHLRDQLPMSLVQFPNGKEWNFVLQMARLYWRMGCGLLTLDLLRNWKFVEQSRDASLEDGSERGEESDGEDEDEESSTGDEEDKAEEVHDEVKAKQPPTTFEEPSTSSLLDSFGY